MTIELIQTGILQGLILAIVALGTMIPFRFLGFPDLTSEGAYPLGGAICTSLLVAGASLPLAMVMGTILGGLLAVCTAQVSLRMKIDSLLAGIIVSTMAYSINLRAMSKPNVALFDTNAFNFNIASIMTIVALCTLPFLLFLYTDFGLRLRSVGLNPKFAKAHGISINKYTSLGLFIAGSMFGLAGALMAQVQQFMDVGMGAGIVIRGLASLMIGEAIVGNNTIPKQLLAPIIGAIIYQQIQGLALSLGLVPSDLKFFTGAILLLILGIQKGGQHAK